MLTETVPQLESEMVRNGRVFPNRLLSSLLAQFLNLVS